MRTEELTSAIFAGKVTAEEVRLAHASLARDARTEPSSRDPPPSPG
jgi:hypothetical protein